jgi:hypothetical protein
LPGAPKVAGFLRHGIPSALQRWSIYSFAGVSIRSRVAIARFLGLAGRVSVNQRFAVFFGVCSLALSTVSVDKLAGFPNVDVLLVAFDVAHICAHWRTPLFDLC